MSKINSNIKDDFQVVLLLSCFVGHPVFSFLGCIKHIHLFLIGYLMPVDLKEIYLHGLVLFWLQGLVLVWSWLQGSVLLISWLQGSVLLCSWLQSSVLLWSWLQGSVLLWPWLHGSVMLISWLQGSVILFSWL